MNQKALHYSNYTYDADGERIVRYVPGRLDAFYSANQAGHNDRLESFIYPSGLLTVKILSLEPGTDLTPRMNLTTYTQHYYVGSERIASSLGRANDLGLFCKDFQIYEVDDYLNEMDSKTTQAGEVLNTDYQYFEKLLNLSSPILYNNSVMGCSLGLDPEKENATYWFHPDHLGSSSYISNNNGTISQHLEYFPFGETLVEEHKNSNNSPYRFNAKELDDETGNYYYGARYYSPKFSIWLSVDPLAEKYPGWSPYNYTMQNPVIYVDPDGRQIEYHNNNSFWFNIGTKLRIFAQSIFGTKETRAMIKQLKETENVITIKEQRRTYLGSNAQPRSLVDYEKEQLEHPIPVPGIDATQKEWDIFREKQAVYENNRPQLHRNGKGDGSYVDLDYETNLNSRNQGVKKTKTTILFHELYHSMRIDNRVVGKKKQEEIKASQFINRNFRNDKNRRKKYGPWDVPKEK